MGIVYHHGTLLPLFPIIGEFCWKVNGILNISEDDILKVDANLALENKGGPIQRHTLKRGCIGYLQSLRAV